MNTIPATRKVKEELTEFFRRGGSPTNLPENLRGVDPAAVLAVYERHIQSKSRRTAATLITSD